ncbi:shikimate dehydrogenase [Sphingomonas sp. Leaf357]|uniref:shikimate dehydrogenase n=1 Tax=Sphingomonas sp. Leaf357 TaxID=1736350 RepID=UPI000AF185DE|nr:shikimate dehydrogenase [Sphingomonas sp. Leaf357]
MTDTIGAEQPAGPDAATSPILTGLIGMDIQGSRSPEMHEREAAAQGIALTYRLLDLAIPPHTGDDLAATLDTVKREGFAGVNVTHPFKQRIIALLDELSDEARAIGAVNTVVFQNGRSTGHNTDSYGFGEGFERQLGGVALNRVVQIGAGGAGAATAMAMVKLGCRDLVIVDPQANRAADLVGRLPGGVARAATRDIAEELAEADGIINATPIGMQGHPGIPIDPALLRAEMWVADVVYFPLETELLRAARAAGCRTAHGGDMAVFQAARAFDLFTGRTADRQRMAAGF